MNSSITARALGKSELKITPVGLGCWQFSKRQNWAGNFWSHVEDETIHKIIAASLEGGINWFDTAEVYGNGASEKALALALQKCGVAPCDVAIATKWWPLFRTASSITKTIDTRIAALAPYPIDLYQVHQPWGFSNEKSEMAAMAELVKSGKVKYIGVSNFSASKMRSSWEALQKAGIPLVSNQVRYSLLDRSIESNGILKTAKELGITIIAYSPLAQGLVTGKFHENPALIKNTGYRKLTPQFRASSLEKSRPLIGLLKILAEKYQVTPSQVALNWMIHFHGETVVVIPGASKESHARENTGAMKFRLSEDDMAAIDRHSREFL